MSRNIIIKESDLLRIIDKLISEAETGSKQKRSKILEKMHNIIDQIVYHVSRGEYSEASGYAAKFREEIGHLTQYTRFLKRIENLNIICDTLSSNIANKEYDEINENISDILEIISLFFI